jgi:hypothetical protein
LVKVLVLVRSIDDVPRLFEDWYSIYPAGVYRLRPRPLIAIGERQSLMVHFSTPGSDMLRGTVWEIIDGREIGVELGQPLPGYLSMIQAMGQARLDGSLEQVMPLEIAWHLALVNGLQCDWGGCAEDACAARYSKGTHEWLPVCFLHQIGPVSAVRHPLAEVE